MTGSPIFSINFKNRKNPANPNYHIVSTSWTSRLWDFYNMFLLGAGLLMFVTIFMIFSFSRWEILTDFSLLMHVQFMINLQSRLVWSGSRHMIVWFSWIFSICEVYWKYRTTGHSVWPWPAVDLKKVLSVATHGFVFWAQRKQNATPEIYKAFQDPLMIILKRHMIV